MIFAHTFIGIIIAYLISNNIELTKDIRTITLKVLKYTLTFKPELGIWFVAMLSSVFPDIDLLYVILINPAIKHRGLLTHSIAPYTIILILSILIIKIKHIDKYYLYLAITAYVGIFLHLIADLYMAPVYMFKPLSQTEFLWKPFELDKNLGLQGYLSSNYMLTEIIIIITGTLLLIKNFISNKKDIIFLLSFIGIIELSAMATLIPFIYSFN